jgi:hypothetical protein
VKIFQIHSHLDAIQAEAPRHGDFLRRLKDICKILEFPLCNDDANLFLASLDHPSLEVHLGKAKPGVFPLVPDFLPRNVPRLDEARRISHLASPSVWRSHPQDLARRPVKLKSGDWPRKKLGPPSIGLVRHREFPRQWSETASLLKKLLAHSYFCTNF